MREPSPIDRLWLAALVAVAVGGAFVAPVESRLPVARADAPAPSAPVLAARPTLTAAGLSATAAADGGALLAVPGVAGVTVLDRPAPMLVVLLRGPEVAAAVKAAVDARLPRLTRLGEQLRYGYYRWNAPVPAALAVSSGVPSWIARHRWQTVAFPGFAR